MRSNQSLIHVFEIVMSIHDIQVQVRHQDTFHWCYCTHSVFTTYTCRMRALLWQSPFKPTPRQEDHRRTSLTSWLATYYLPFPLKTSSTIFGMGTLLTIRTTKHTASGSEKSAMRRAKNLWTWRSQIVQGQRKIQIVDLQCIYQLYTCKSTSFGIGSLFHLFF